MSAFLSKMVLPSQASFQTHQNAFHTPITCRAMPFHGLPSREGMKGIHVGRFLPQHAGSLQVLPVLDEEKQTEDDEEMIPVKEPEKKLADRWEEIQGRNDWEGLLDPFDSSLLSELMKYGEMAQACYDAFDSEQYSRYCGSCRYEPEEFFQRLGLAHHRYQVTRYVYASSNISLPSFFKKSISKEGWSQKANWIGYVAVSDDETSAYLGRRDITIAWRGTVTRPEWIADFIDFLWPVTLNKIPCPDRRLKVESGFLHLYTDKHESCEYCSHSAREQVLAEVKELKKKYKDEDLSITITGHSLGSALAMLSAYDIAETGTDVMDDMRVAPVCVFSFSGPRVGNNRFKQRLEELGVKVLRVLNIHDRVPQAPGILFNERIPAVMRTLGEMSPWCYSHVGVELALDHKNSPFLKETNDLKCLHDLETLLHLLDGYHGKGEKFALRGRDIALVNKATDFLKKHLLVPPHWLQPENKGLIRNHEGEWRQPERHNLRDHLRAVHHQLQKINDH